MNSEKSKTSDPHRLLFNPIDKTDLRRKDKYIALSNLSILYTWKNIRFINVLSARAPKTLIRHTKKLAPKINSDVCFKKIL